MERAEYSNIEELFHAMAKAASESATYKKLAFYLEKEYRKIIFMTAEEVAKNCGVSQGSVSRFCMVMGFKGYSDFYKHLQKIVTEELTAPQRYQYTKSGKKKIDDILLKEAGNIRELTGVLGGGLYEKMVDDIVKAEKIFLVSARMSATLLPYMKYLLDKLRDQVEIVTPDSSGWNRFYLENPEQALIISTCFPRYSKALVDKLKELKEEGFSIYAMTDRRVSPTIQAEIPSIVVPITTTSIFDLYSTPMAFINLTLRDVSKKIPDLDKRLEKIENYDNKYGVFYR
ncbi:MurR/RpiR family transcriptional regulator [Clostridium sp. HBUAS56010]|uniref:MurR/RpiR family transcriptional regulator n=1 Tax=Clostridium sp. HBUAS56010 TaxID=2571127 RepID=UPI001177BF5A|nr:MurR/RpiR family transcriptional regulator [Clostridium sp. HBUAS56010]